MSDLELSVAIDLYVSDTSRHCDFVLPATTMYEREDFPLPFLSLFTTPFIQMTDPVTGPAGEARQEWEIIDQISRRAGVVPSSLRLLRWAGKAGVRLSPERLVRRLTFEGGVRLTIASKALTTSREIVFDTEGAASKTGPSKRAFGAILAALKAH